MATKPLSFLFDISSVENLTLLSSRFAEIAEALLHKQYLRIEHQGVTTDFELLEIEFYLQKPNIHEDPFCHAHEDQQISAQWYFHRAPKQTSSPIKASTTAQGYRGGTRKGLDLTFGPPVTSSFFPVKESAECRGGILLRSMRQCSEDAEVISGPSLLVDKILSITKSRNVSDLVTNKLGGDISALGTATASAPNNLHQSRMYLTSRPHTQKNAAACPAVHRSPRIGLDLSHPSVSPQFTNCRVVYLAKLYRYFIHPELLKANGRCHTLFGLYLELISGSAEDPLDYGPALTGSLMGSMNISRATMERYLGDYADGFKNRSLHEYVGALGKGACSNPKGFMRLMGVLGRKGLFGGSKE